MRRTIQHVDCDADLHMLLATLTRPEGLELQTRAVPRGNASSFPQERTWEGWPEVSCFRAEFCCLVICWGSLCVKLDIGLKARHCRQLFHPNPAERTDGLGHTPRLGQGSVEPGAVLWTLPRVKCADSVKRNRTGQADGPPASCCTPLTNSWISKQKTNRNDKSLKWLLKENIWCKYERTESDVQRPTRQARAVVRTSGCPDDRWLRTISFNVFYCTVSFRSAMSRQPEGVYGCVLLATRVEASLYLCNSLGHYQSPLCCSNNKSGRARKQEI